MAKFFPFCSVQHFSSWDLQTAKEKTQRELAWQQSAVPVDCCGCEFFQVCTSPLPCIVFGSHLYLPRHILDASCRLGLQVQQFSANEPTQQLQMVLQDSSCITFCIREFLDGSEALQKVLELQETFPQVLR